jgi:probable rRNA maturation factor
MTVHLSIRNESARKRLYSAPALRRLAEKICSGEGVTGEAEISLLFCDDDFIQTLNQQYRKKNEATDVLSFQADVEGLPPEGHAVLGDIVISLETVEQRNGTRDAMRNEIYLLFCHGALHLLGYTHGKPAERRVMAAKQAEYLGLAPEAAWPAEGAQCAPVKISRD